MPKKYITLIRSAIFCVFLCINVIASPLVVFDKVERILKDSVAKLAAVHDDISSRITKVEKAVSAEVRATVVTACFIPSYLPRTAFETSWGSPFLGFEQRFPPPHPSRSTNSTRVMRLVRRFPSSTGASRASRIASRQTLRLRWTAESGTIKNFSTKRCEWTDVYRARQNSRKLATHRFGLVRRVAGIQVGNTFS